MAEALVLARVGGALGILLAYALAAAIGTLPFYGPLYEDTSGKGDIHLYICLTHYPRSRESCHAR